MSDFDESALDNAGNWSADAEDTHSPAGRARVRAQLQADIEAFLQSGGQIQELDTHFQSGASRKVEVGFNNRSM
ncbi:hypothetical protein SAMN05216429_10285 [Marinobacter persicus]|uniref:Transcriptional regulator SutA RNAP-binding domain-containing protein n=1 Tax=Marinobacter persicus TaxID=930118 RepID=A0A1I3QNS9_9GAMM|nr:hypothetical protein [Marinobacter persicus]GHD42771.1 hypothetical protein GCM10008110_05920 [Marinobacter persicus]SFJ35758.1 hypothetical protein SAMN05216429_10285 [Marinobacter persicus]